MHSPSSKYIPSEESEGPDFGSSEKLLGQAFVPTQSLPFIRPIWRLSLPWVTHGTLCSLYAIVFLVMSFHPSFPTQTACVDLLSTYSPANPIVEYHTTYFNGSFNHPSLYRGQPNPELDATWERLSTSVQPTRISKEMLAKIGKKDVPSLVKYPEEDGGGYMASLEATHHLHCLNFLRKYTYHEYYDSWDPAFLAKPDVFRTHLDHCVELLRQNLMCAADTGLNTYHWIEGHDTPWADFSSKHTCRNYYDVLQWSYDNAVHIARDRVVRVGEVVDLVNPP